MKRTLGFALLFTAAYILVFSTPLKKEPVFTPRWVENLAAPSRIADASSTGSSFGFRIGNVFGYATPDGAIRYLNTAQFDVAMSGKRFINYSSVSNNLVEKDSTGRILVTIPAKGYPILSGGRFFIIGDHRMALAEMTSDGSRLWRRNFGSLITSMEATPRNLVIGLLDGRLLLLNKKGEATYAYTPKGSKIEAIYGCAVSSDGRYIAVVSGLDPQRFTLLRRASKGYRPERVADLPTSVRHQVFLHFFPGVPYVYIERPGAIDYFPLGRGKAGTVAVEGQVRAMAAGRGPLLYALSAPARHGRGKAAPGGELSAFTATGSVLARSPLAGSRFFLKTRGDALYVGTDMTLMRFDPAWK